LLATAGLLSVLRAMPGGGSAMTAFNVTSGVGSSGGLLVGGLLTSSLGWRAVFWSSAAIAALLVVGALSARPVAGERRRAASPIPAAPGDDVRPAGGASTAIACVANLLVYGNYAIWVVALPLYANGRFGASAEQIGLLLMVINAIHLLAAFPALRIIRLAGAPVALGFGFATTAVGLALALAAPSALWLWAPMAVYAIGQVAGNSAAGDLILRHGGGASRAVGMVRLSSDVGMVAGPAAAGWLADAAGYGAPFAALAAISAGAAFAVVALRGRGWLRSG
jgi:MFS family permease